MTQFKGFKTMEEAKAFKKKNGKGMIVWDKRTPKLGKHTNISKEYYFCVGYGGLDEKTYPYAVVWNI